MLLPDSFCGTTELESELDIAIDLVFCIFKKLVPWSCAGNASLDLMLLLAFMMTKFNKICNVHAEHRPV